MTDITELAQLRGRTVDYPYYLVECDCGKIYPSSELSGGEPMGDSGDYSDCYCPHCGEGEEHFAECADPETAWKAQQDKIDALVEVLEKAQQRNAELEAQNEYIRKRSGKISWLCRLQSSNGRPLAMLKTGWRGFITRSSGQANCLMKRRKTHRPISTANMLRSMKSLWRFTSGFGNRARLNVPPLASRWRLSDGTDTR